MRKIKLPRVIVDSDKMDHIEKGADLSFFTNIFHFRTKLEKQADRECRYLEIIKLFIMRKYKLNEIDALADGLDLLRDFKIWRLI